MKQKLSRIHIYCTARRESAVTSFTATRTGFTAQADLEAENLVLFSVPYDCLLYTSAVLAAAALPQAAGGTVPGGGAGRGAGVQLCVDVYKRQAYTTIAPALTATLCRRPAVW